MKCGALAKMFCSGPRQWRRQDLCLIAAGAGSTKGGVWAWGGGGGGGEGGWGGGGGGGGWGGD